MSPEEFFNRVSFAFQMAWTKDRMFVKFKEPYYTMDCFELLCDLDHGVYPSEGDMRFNDFMGEQITDSGSDINKFIIDWIKTKPIRFKI